MTTGTYAPYPFCPEHGIESEDGVCPQCVQYVQCTACGEVVEATEPCSCVFDVVGTVDAYGVLHTAERVTVQGEHVPGMCKTPMPKAKPFTCPACKGYMVMEAEDYCGPGTEYMCVECGNHWDA